MEGTLEVFDLYLISSEERSCPIILRHGFPRFFHKCSWPEFVIPPPFITTPWWWWTNHVSTAPLDVFSAGLLNSPVGYQKVGDLVM